MCKWPIGDPASESFSFCGRNVEAGPYCQDHAAVAYRPCRRPEARRAALAALIRRFAI
jgi:GcrA cell cycle regulator